MNEPKKKRQEKPMVFTPEQFEEADVVIAGVPLVAIVPSRPRVTEKTAVLSPEEMEA